MNDRPLRENSSVELREWKGLYSNANPHSLGAEFNTVQENAVSIVAGQIQTRGGLVKVVFEGQTET